MSVNEHKNQAARYTDGVNSMEINPNSGLTLSDGLTNLIINRNGFSNGTNDVSLTDFYANVQKTRSINSSESTPTNLSVNSKISITDLSQTSELTPNMLQLNGTQNSVIIQANPSVNNVSCIVATNNTTYATGIKVDELFSADISAFPTIVRSTLSPTSLTTQYTYSRLRQPTDTNTATFDGFVLSIDGSNNSYQNSGIIFTGTSNLVRSLNLTNMIIGGIYYVGIYNNASGTLTFPNRLGYNISTGASVVVDPDRTILMTINVVYLNSQQRYIVTFNLLNRPASVYQLNAPWASFRGTIPNFYGQSRYNAPLSAPMLTPASSLINFDNNAVIDTNGFIYACSADQEYLYSFNQDLTVRWSYDTDGICAYNNICIGRDGSIYVSNPINGSNSRLYSVNPNGTQNWVVQVSGLTHSGGNSNILIDASENIYIATTTGTLYKISSSGSLLHTFNGFNGEDLTGGNSSIDSATQYLYLCSLSYFYIVDIYNDTIINSLDLSTQGLIGNQLVSPVVIGGFVYDALYHSSTDYGVICQFNKYTGALVSSLPLIPPTTPFNLEIVGNSFVVDRNENLYCGANSMDNTTHYLIKFDKNLNVLNYYSVDGDLDQGSGVLTNNDLLIFNEGTPTNRIVCYDLSGTRIWATSQYSTNPSTATPALSADSIIYMPTDLGLVSYNVV